MTTANNNHLPLVHQGASLKTWDDVKGLVADWYLGDLQEWMSAEFIILRIDGRGKWWATKATTGHSEWSSTPRAAALALKAKMEGE